MKDKLLENIKINVIMTFGIGILNFIVNKYFALYLGMDELGIMKLFTQMVSYLTIADLGISSASAYALYKPLSENDKDKVSLIISTIDFFYKRISIIIIIAGFLCSFLIPYFVKVSSENYYIYIYWYLYVISVSLGYPLSRYAILFTANQEYGFVRIIQGTGQILLLTFQIFIIIYLKSFLIFLLLMVVENYYNFYFYRKHYKKYYSYIKIIKNKDKNIIKNMKKLFWHRLSGLIVNNTDYIILSKFVSLSIVGIYSSYLMVVQMILATTGILTPILLPKIGLLISQKSKEEVYEYWWKSYSFYIFLATVVITSTYILMPLFIKLWLGEEFILPRFTQILILINLYITLIKGIIDVFKNSFGFFEDIYTPIIEGLINFLVSIILVKNYGLDGVIIGTISSNIIVVIILKPILIFKNCFIRSLRDYLKKGTNLFILSILSFYISNKLFKVIINMNDINNNWRNFICISAINIILSLSITTILFLTDKFFKELFFLILEKMLRIIKERNG